MVGMIFDITDRRLALETKARLATIFQSSPDAIVGKSLDGTITNWNGGAEHMYGFSAEEAIGQSISIIVPPDREEEERGIIERLRHGARIKQYETVRVTRDGKRRFVSLTISPIANDHGEVESIATIARDITERRRYEESIRRMNDQLSRQAADLARANAELEAFSYSVSHDLQAPLRSIDGFSMVLLEDYADQLDETGKDYLNRVRGASQKVARLIDDLLTLSRISRTELHHEEVDLSQLAGDTIAALRSTEPDRTVEVSIAEGLSSTADRRLVEIVVNNLLRNAWKFTAGRADAEIEFTSFEDDGRRVFVVRDNGAGFDMAYADKLFLPFQRLHSATEFSGTGVGLSLVKRIVERHGGRIWGEGATGEGASFYFSL